MGLKVVHPTLQSENGNLVDQVYDGEVEKWVVEQGEGRRQ
jgi:hypothetical protein